MKQDIVLDKEEKIPDFEELKKLVAEKNDACTKLQDFTNYERKVAENNLKVICSFMKSLHNALGDLDAFEVMEDYSVTLYDRFFKINNLHPNYDDPHIGYDDIKYIKDLSSKWSKFKKALMKDLKKYLKEKVDGYTKELNEKDPIVELEV